MTEWAILRDAYGSANNIPVLIDAWIDDPAEERLSDLWSRLCHQGTVYSASFAAIPILQRACARLASKDRRNALMLMGAILASADRFDDAGPDAATTQLLPSLMQMTDIAMTDDDVDVEEFPYLLQAAFHGDAFWGRNFDHLPSGEFLGVCPQCTTDLYLVIGRYGYFATAEDWVSRKNARRVPITPSSEDKLPSDGAWLFWQAMRHAQREAAQGVLRIFGDTRCPSCDCCVSVVGAIRGGPAAYELSAPGD